MKLSTYQYDILKQEFNQKQINARYELDKRTEEIYQKIPEIKEIDDTIASESVKAGKSALTGDDSLLSKLKDTINDLSEKKERLLLNNGYPADYLIEHYECPICKDKGFIGNEPCGAYGGK